MSSYHVFFLSVSWLTHPGWFLLDPSILLGVNFKMPLFFAILQVKLEYNVLLFPLMFSLDLTQEDNNEFYMCVLETMVCAHECRYS